MSQCLSLNGSGDVYDFLYFVEINLNDKINHAEMVSSRASLKTVNSRPRWEVLVLMGGLVVVCVSTVKIVVLQI